MEVEKGKETEIDVRGNSDGMIPVLVLGNCFFFQESVTEVKAKKVCRWKLFFLIKRNNDFPFHKNFKALLSLIIKLVNDHYKRTSKIK